MCIRDRDTQIRFDGVWEQKVATRILHILSKLMDRSFESVKDLNRYRKEMTALVMPKEKEIILAGA